MRRKTISKKSVYTKLYTDDLKFINNEVQEHKDKDKNFINNSAAVRHYVHVGIVAEMQTDRLINTLDNKVVRQSQKNAVRDELKPLAANIENLENTITELMEKNGLYFNEIMRSSRVIENLLDQKLENVLKSLVDLLSESREIKNTVRESLRNIIILRTVFYLFLIGYRTDRIINGVENQKVWISIVKLAHAKANELTDEELHLIDINKFDEVYIRNVTRDIFNEIQRLKLI